ncbi:MAG TPA: chromosome segregation protein SMC, partial [Burkholderiaceae bacterium]|nr:chromosome segregation protein SMC [Burkholderiaceae bacterium]
LRGAERALEDVRNAHFAASDAAHAAQGTLFQVNAEVAKLESEIRLIAESRTRLSAQVESLATTRNGRLNEQAELGQRATDLVHAIVDMSRQLEEAKASVSAHEAKLPQLEQTYRTTRDAVTAAQADAALAEQSIEAAASEQRNADRQLAQLAQRRERLSEEQASIGSPDEAQLASLKKQLANSEGEITASAESQQRGEAHVDRMTEQRQQRLDDRARQTEALARIEARLQALKQVQASVEANAKLDPWLRSQGLENLPRLFRKLVVEPGWETAFESVLRERVQGVEVGRLDTIGGLAADAPPARVAFYSTSGATVRDPRELPQMPGFSRLSDRVRTHDAAFAAILADWLANVFVADDLASALAARGDLPPGGQFVVKAAHRVSRHDVHFYAADEQASGLLARRLEIENLEREVRAQRLIVEEAIAAVARAEVELRSAQQAREAGRQDAERQRSQMHVLQLESVRLEELIDRVRHRSGQIGNELHEIETNEREARSQRGQADTRFDQLDAELSTRQEAVESARLTYEESDRALRAARDEQRVLDTARQHCEFALNSNRERELDLTRGAEAASVDAQRLAAEITKADDELKRL